MSDVIITIERNHSILGRQRTLRTQAHLGYGEFEEAVRRQQTEVTGPEITLEISEVARPDWSVIDEDLFNSIMLKLQEVSVIRSSAVCKGWNCMINSETFEHIYSEQLVFPFAVKGSRYFFQRVNAAGMYNFDMQPFGSSEVPYLFPAGGDTPCQEGAGGLFYFFTGNVLHYKLNLVQRKWVVTPPMTYRRHKPVVGVIRSRTRIDGAHKVVVACGSPDVFRDEHLSVEIYDSAKGIWDVGSSLPSEFGGHESWINPAVHDGKFFVFDTKRMFCCILDLNNDAWGIYDILTPVDEDMTATYLVENSTGLSLVLIALCLSTNYSPLITPLIRKPVSSSRILSLKAWNVDPLSLMITNQTHHTTASVDVPVTLLSILRVVLGDLLSMLIVYRSSVFDASIYVILLLLVVIYGHLKE